MTTNTPSQEAITLTQLRASIKDLQAHAIQLEALARTAAATLAKLPVAPPGGRIRWTDEQRFRFGHVRTLIVATSDASKTLFYRFDRMVDVQAMKSVGLPADSLRAYQRTGKWLIAASTQAEFYRCSLLVYGSYAAAAHAIGVSLSSYRRRLAKDPSAATLLQQFSSAPGRRPYRPPKGQTVLALGLPEGLRSDGLAAADGDDDSGKP